MHPILHHVDRQLGDPPRKFSRDEWRDLTIPEPNWIRQRKDDLAVVFDDQRLLLKEGEVVWGTHVQANSLLFRRGFANCPATFIYSRHPDIDDDPDLLTGIAERLFALKGKRWRDSYEQRYGDMLADEWERAMRMRAPPTLTDGLPVTSTSVFVCRRHLPERTLGLRAVPLLRHPDTPATVIVPHWFWPKAYVERWAAAVNERTADQRWVTVHPRAAVWLRELAARDRMPDDWVLRIEVVRSEDGTREGTRWGVFADLDPERDRVFQTSGIRVAIREPFADDLRGVTVELVGEGRDRDLSFH
jgi:hypothetical protein